MTGGIQLHNFHVSCYFSRLLLICYLYGKKSYELLAYTINSHYYVANVCFWRSKITSLKKRGFGVRVTVERTWHVVSYKSLAKNTLPGAIVFVFKLLHSLVLLCPLYSLWSLSGCSSVWFGLVSLFNGISTFVGCLMPNHSPRRTVVVLFNQ